LIFLIKYLLDCPQINIKHSSRYTLDVGELLILPLQL